MSTVIRAVLSSKNKYWIDKHRYYELKHFCLQYPIWRREYAEIDGISSVSLDTIIFSRSNTPNDPTYMLVEHRIQLTKRVELIEQTAIEIDPELASYILMAVTEELSYNHLKTKLDIPCSRDMYYDRYRRFFWLLDKTRD